MVIAEKSLVIEDVMRLLDDKSIKYNELIVEDEKIVQINLVRERKDSDKQFISEINITIQDKPKHLFIYCNNVFKIENDSFITSILQELAEVNLKRIIYGNMGFDDSDKSIIYTNGVSLAGRKEIIAEELLDYIFYAGFICEKINLHLDEKEKSMNL
ncbi:hypothetical protein [Paenibacillus xylanexedens]|uniref:hypothetical protein n=1 Tax=Paenibacillus xylanexedens TaxID=528191 RepID=UPI001C92E7A5|nr:hypothetical protein [Paenibacillus xylanexedens]